MEKRKLRTRFVGRAVFVALTLAVLLAPTAPRADFAAGERAYSLGQFARAIEELRPLVERGDARAQMMTGLMYLQGNGYARSPEIAAVWLYKAATKGDTSAQLVLGSQLLYGQGIRRDETAAFIWLILAGQSDVEGVAQQSQVFRNDALTRMTDEQVAEATRKAERFRPRPDGYVAED
jgi:TPR repeat protein